jgi:hypothetical protein
MSRVARVAAALAVAIPFAHGGTARAEGFYWAFQYAPSVPVGSVRSFAAKVSPVAFDLDARYWFTRHLSLGVNGRFVQFFEKFGHDTFQFPDGAGAITGTIFREVDVLAALPEVHYYFGSEGHLIPYAGVGCGASWATFRTRLSDIDIDQTIAGLIVSPEGGVLIPVDRQDDLLLQSLMLGLRYSYSTGGYRSVSDVSWIGVQIGALVY